MQTAQYFPPDYSSARQSFLVAAQACGAEIESFIAPELSTKGEELFTDVAVLGQTDAANALVIISGTHGVEGFPAFKTVCYLKVFFITCVLMLKSY
jgi:aspartate carbamoyltransferase catalytic subunit